VRQADRFESEAVAFFQRVRDAYLARAAQAPDRFMRLDGLLTIEAIRTRLEADLSSSPNF
jgi:dTMP kinase